MGDQAPCMRLFSLHQAARLRTTKSYSHPVMRSLTHPVIEIDNVWKSMDSTNVHHKVLENPYAEQCCWETGTFKWQCVSFSVVVLPKSVVADSQMDSARSTASSRTLRTRQLQRPPAAIVSIRNVPDAHT